jgi:hypothetical protein
VQVDGYVPTGEDAVADVEHVGVVVTLLAVSPLTKPAYDAVITGTEPPYVMVPFDAVTVSDAGVTATPPGT